MKKLCLMMFTALLFGFSVEVKASHQVCHCKLNKFSGGTYQQFNDYSSLLNYKLHKAILLTSDYGNCRVACRNWVLSNQSLVQSHVCSNPSLSNTEIRVISDINDLVAGQVAVVGEKILTDVMKCNAPWMSNTTNVVGGVTGDGRCKLEHIVVTVSPPLNPPPANGTPIGNWGFYWGNALVEYGTPANGGVAVPTGQKLCSFKIY